MRQRVYQTPLFDGDELKHHLPVVMTVIVEQAVSASFAALA